MPKEKADNFIKKKSSYDIKAICNNCKKRFVSLRAITLHLKIKAHHTVKIIEHGKYNKHTGVKK
jgi:hypothetical protein